MIFIVQSSVRNLVVETLELIAPCTGSDPRRQSVNESNQLHTNGMAFAPLEKSNSFLLFCFQVSPIVAEL